MKILPAIRDDSTVSRDFHCFRSAVIVGDCKDALYTLPNPLPLEIEIDWTPYAALSSENEIDRRTSGGQTGSRGRFYVGSHSDPVRRSSTPSKEDEEAELKDQIQEKRETLDRTSSNTPSPRPHSGNGKHFVQSWSQSKTDSRFAAYGRRRRWGTSANMTMRRDWVSTNRTPRIC